MEVGCRIRPNLGSGGRAAARVVRLKAELAALRASRRQKLVAEEPLVAGAS